jgi:hypothetical protein
MNPILEKVKKLLALAGNAGTTEGERDNALRMAHGLLAKHNLDMADLHAHCQQEGREDYTHAYHGIGWCRYVSNSIAKLFFCKYYYGRKVNSYKVEHHFVGKTSNTATAALMSEYVIRSILKECRNRFGHELNAQARSFALGAQSKIAERVAELIKEAKPEGGTSTSLVVQALYKTEVEANEAFLKADGTKLVTKNPRSSHVNMSAYSDGKTYGGSIGLNTQIVNRNQLKLN